MVVRRDAGQSVYGRQGRRESIRRRPRDHSVLCLSLYLCEDAVRELGLFVWSTSTDFTVIRKLGEPDEDRLKF